MFFFKIFQKKKLTSSLAGSLKQLFNMLEKQYFSQVFKNSFKLEAILIFSFGTQSVSEFG